MEYVKKGFHQVLIEKIKNPRYFIKLPLDYRRVGTSEFRYSHTVSFCDGGLKIAGLEPIETGAEIEIKIYFASGPDLVVIPAIARVIWTPMEAEETGFIGFGVSFLQISLKDLKTLENLLKNYADPTIQCAI